MSRSSRILLVRRSGNRKADSWYAEEIGKAGLLGFDTNGETRRSRRRRRNQRSVFSIILFFNKLFVFSGCSSKKRTDFLKRLHGTLVSSMIASGHSDTEDMSPGERALRWKFDELDKNKNKVPFFQFCIAHFKIFLLQVLERKEWKPYRQELKTWKGMRKCGRNFLRSCDANGDKRITLHEWLTCTRNSLRGESYFKIFLINKLKIFFSAATATVKPNNRRGPNPFVNILDPHQ